MKSQEQNRYCNLKFGNEPMAFVRLAIGSDSIAIDHLGRTTTYPFRTDSDNSGWKEAVVEDLPGSIDPFLYRDLRIISTADFLSMSMRCEAWELRDCRQNVDELPTSIDPRQAPEIDFHGPLKLKTSLEPHGRDVALVVQVGTQSRYGAFACVSACLARQMLARPIADLHFPTKDGGKRSILLDLGWDC